MSFLRINGWPIKAQPGSVKQERMILGGDRFSEQAKPIFYRRRTVLEWSGRSTRLVQDEADAMEGILCGLGYRMPFDSNLFSTRGRGPLALGGAAIVAGGVFGGFCASITSLTYDFASGVCPILDRWTVMVFRQEAGVFRHYIVRSDGAVFFEGIRDDSVSVSSWLTVFDGFVTLSGAPTLFDELVVLCFTASTEQCTAWYSRMRNERIPFSSLPRLDVDGDLFGARTAQVIGSVDGDQEHVTFGDRAALPNGTFWRNNGRTVPFKMQQVRAAPVLDIPHPEAMLIFDVGYFGPPPTDLATPRILLGTSGTPTASTNAQVADGADFDGSPDSFTFIGAGLDKNESDPMGMSAAVHVDADAPLAVMCVIGKIDVGVTPGWWLFVTPKANGFCDVDLHIRNIAGTLGRRVTATDAFRVDEWHHIVASNDARLDVTGLSIFIDGARFPTSGVQNSAPGATTNASLARVARNGAASFGFVGQIDEIGFWSVALSASSAYQLFRAASQRRHAQFAGE